MYLLNLDDAVIKYTGDVAFKSIEEAQLFIENYVHYTNCDYGRWPVNMNELMLF